MRNEKNWKLKLETINALILGKGLYFFFSNIKIHSAIYNLKNVILIKI